MKIKVFIRTAICAGLLALIARIPVLPAVSAASAELGGNYISSKGKESINSKDAARIAKLQKMDYKQVIKRIKTPKEAEWYIRNYIIQKDDNADVAKSFRAVHETREGDCSEGVIAAAALLSDNGYPPTWLFLEDSRREKENHGVFLYQRHGRWGTIGINARDNSLPKYRTLDEIARGLGYDKCEIKELKKTNLDGWTPWIDSRRDLYGSGRVLMEDKEK
ncbi:hypothetical protein HYT92_03450 [Candidatus Pacearchaeota archaeon]|nr:hypothetical protein [Candidatus Pacearchaeota archaeon]